MNLPRKGIIVSVLRRTLVAASVLVLVGMTGTATAFAESSGAAQGDLDCKDFATQEEAQAELEKDRSDPHGLDGNDNDGMACESLPSAPVTTTSPPPDTTEPPASSKEAATTPAFADKDCADFATKGDAQATLDADRSDPHRLDADDDGLACEAHFSDGEDDQQVRVHPVGGVATGGNGGEGDDSGALAALGAFVLSGAGAALVARRRAHGGH